jgi:hypothetical protein
MRLFRPAATLVLLSAAGLLLVVPQMLRSNTTPNAEMCRGLGSQEATERCLVDTMLATDSLTAAAQTLDGVLDKDELLQLACHEATHEVGKRLHSESLEISTFLRDPSAGVCEWGLVHGVLAAAVEERSEPDRVDTLLDVCAGLPDSGTQQACGDSVGHALWEIEEAFAPAVMRCMQTVSPAGDACVSGVFMQLYRPVAPSSQASESASIWAPPISREEVAELCASLPDDRSSSACAAAAHYAFAPDLQNARDRVLATTDPLAAAETVFLPVLDDALTFCAGFSAADRCSMEVTRYALQMLRYLPSTEVEALVCGRVQTKDVLTHCQNAAAAIL